MIRTQKELLAALANPEMRLFWNMGNRPADSGSYKLQSNKAHSESTTVHGNAANAAIKANKVRLIRRSWMNAVYRLA